MCHMFGINSPHWDPLGLYDKGLRFFERISPLSIGNMGEHGLIDCVISLVNECGESFCLVDKEPSLRYQSVFLSFYFGLTEG